MSRKIELNIGKDLQFIRFNGTLVGVCIAVSYTHLLAPRDYLATFLKIGVIVGLALGIVVLNPELKMPAMTQYIEDVYKRQILFKAKSAASGA